LVERLMPFCVLVGAMSCYLNLSRRLELVVARAAGLSAWQLVAPAVLVALALGVLATTVYNPISAWLEESAKRLEADIFGGNSGVLVSSGDGFWVRQQSPDGQSVVFAKTSRQQGVSLDAVTVFTFDAAGRFRARIEAERATLQRGHWRLENARIYALNQVPAVEGVHLLKTNLTPEQVRETFATPETVPFWDLPQYIDVAEQAGLSAAGYRYQYQKLLARPVLFLAMVLLAAAVSLRFFRFGGVQKFVLSGVLAGFLLYVLSKITEDMTEANLMNPAVAAWSPVLAGGLTGLVVLLYQEDG
jgi:lipopolysaccharide export system permease protein